MVSDLVLGSNDLSILLDEIINEITEKVTYANRMDNLPELLEKWGLRQLIKEDEVFESYKDGKIVIIGQSDVKERELRSIAKALKVKNNFEFNLEYYDAEKYQYNKLMYAPSYRVVMFGPIPHSSQGKHDSSSAIAEMESKPNIYPRVVRLGKDGELKITKTGFKRALYQLIEEGYIETIC